MKYFILFCSIFIASCSAQKSVISDYNSEGFAIASLKGSSIRLHVNPVIDANRFGNAFEKEYPSKKLFCSSLSDDLKKRLGTFSTVSIDTNSDVDNLFINQSALSDQGAAIKGVFEQMNENYLLGIKQVILSQDVNQNARSSQAPTAASAPRGRAPIRSSSPTGIKTNDCVMKIVVEVWSVKEKKKVAEFTSIGQSKIVLLAFGRAINEALEESVSNIADYIEE